MIAMTFASKLVKLREQKGWSQRDLVRAVGDISSTAVSNWEKGAIPAMDVALKVARALGVPLDYLADDSQDEPMQASGLNEAEMKVLWAAETVGYELALKRIMRAPESHAPPGRSWGELKGREVGTDEVEP